MVVILPLTRASCHKLANVGFRSNGCACKRRRDVYKIRDDQRGRGEVKEGSGLCGEGEDS